MNVIDYNKTFFESIKAKLPTDVNPVLFTMNALSISKEAAYRRIRGEVLITLQESVLLAKALHVSLNELVYPENDKTYRYSIYMIDFESPDEADLLMLQRFRETIGGAGRDPLSQLGISSNTFPLQLLLRYKSLGKYVLFKWLYMSGNRKAKAFHEIVIKKQMQQAISDIRLAYLQFSTTCYIFDRQLSRSLVNDLRYFISTGLLTSKDAGFIRDEAHKLLDYMEQLAITGKHEIGKTITMYVSDINFGKSFQKIKIGEFHASIIETCVLNGLVSKEKNSFRKSNEWFNSQLRHSMLISQSGEPQRIAFFKEQHAQLEELQITDNQ